MVENHFYVHVTSSNCESYDVGPFEVSGGLAFDNGAIDWIYKQIGLIKIQHPEAVLIKHQWNYKEKSNDIFGEEAVVEVNIEIAGFSFVIHQLKTAKYTQVIDELIERDKSKPM